MKLDAKVILEGKKRAKIYLENMRKKFKWHFTARKAPKSNKSIQQAKILVKFMAFVWQYLKLPQVSAHLSKLLDHFFISLKKIIHLIARQKESYFTLYEDLYWKFTAPKKFKLRILFEKKIWKLEESKVQTKLEPREQLRNPSFLWKVEPPQCTFFLFPVKLNYNKQL